MINFHKVNSHLFRGGSLAPKDVVHLKEKYGIEKIVSLDAGVAQKINRTTKLLGIKHIILPIDIGKRSSLIKFLHWDIKDLLGGEKVFVGCVQGKDRTGLAVAMYRCEHDGWSCGRALKEAKKYGFGIGVDPKVVHLYKKIINQSCKCQNEDLSFAYDIVSNQREYPSDYADYSLGAWEQQSWSPYEDYRVREFPYADTYTDSSEQYQSRIDHGLDDSDALSKEHIEMPQIGQYDQNTEGINGAGPSMVGGGFV